MPKNKAQSKIFMKCLEIHKHRISKTILNTEGCYDVLFDKLDNIPNLEKLHVLDDNANTTKSLLTIIEEITQKNELQKLKFFSLQHLSQLTQFTRLKTVQPLPNLTSLEILATRGLIIIDDTVMPYLMKKVPNLIKLKIHTGVNAQLALTAITTSEEPTVQFLEYISNLSECYIDTIATNENTANIIKKACTNIEKKSQKFSCLFIKYDKNASEVGLNGHNRRHSYIQIDINKLYPKPSSNLHVIFDTHIINEQRELDLVKQAGQFFTEMNIDEVPADIYYQLLKHIAQYCTRLESLCINRGHKIETFESENLHANQTLTNLTLNACDITPDTMSVISSLFPRLNNLKLISLPLKRFGAKRSLVISMSNLSLDHLRLELKFPGNVSSSKKTITGLCIKLRTSKSTKFLLFDFQEVRKEDMLDHYPMEFARELTVDEFELIEDNPQYFICRASCKSLQSFSLYYTTTANMTASTDQHFYHKTHHVDLK